MRKHLVGSWAGAIGHLQVNPSNVLAHGTDGDGDGKSTCRIAGRCAGDEREVPARLGYTPASTGATRSACRGLRLPAGRPETLRPLAFFTARGVKRVNGKPFVDSSIPVFFYAPAGAKGPKFLMTSNYLVLKGYNFSDSYALSVAHLADRLKGGGDFTAAGRATRNSPICSSARPSRRR